ncbi:MAG: virulence RhuM family protein [Phycisphaerae bacterium]|nr:virulence RhuM family protein [Phycisphaerae bacterium]
MNDDHSTRPPGGEIIVYQAEDGRNRIRVRLDEGTVWLPQALIAELYETSPQNITTHIKSIYESGELEESATCKDYLQVRDESGRTVRRQIKHYSLDIILAVGYRVRSPRGTQFRQWATERLSEYLIKGFTLDDERLKGGSGLVDYFDELLARIREIRASEARVYQRIREIFALASDYREGERETQLFFATMQNKMHYAAAGMTAAEIVRSRADADKANMGLTSWKGGQVLKRDVGTAKNYLSGEEIDTLNRVTVMFLDQAEFRAQRRKDIRMHDWSAFLDKFLRDTELPVLPDAGSITHEDAIDWANQQYDTFADRRRVEAEAEAEKNYVEDLRESANTLEAERKKLPAEKTRKKAVKARKKGRKRTLPKKGRE